MVCSCFSKSQRHIIRYLISGVYLFNVKLMLHNPLVSLLLLYLSDLYYCVFTYIQESFWFLLQLLQWLIDHSVAFFFYLVIFIWKAGFMEREGKTERRSSLDWFMLRIAVMGRVELIWNRKWGASARSPMQTQRRKVLSCPPLLSQTTSRERILKWRTNTQTGANNGIRHLQADD